MEKKSFLNLFGLGNKDTVTVNAIKLQSLIKENDEKDLLVEELNKSNTELVKRVEFLEEELKVKDENYEKCLDYNDKLYNTVIKQDNSLKEVRSILNSTNTRLGKALHQAKDADVLRDRLTTANALSEYRRNQSMLDNLTDPLYVELS